MSDQTPALPVLARGLDQLGELLGMVRPDDARSATPCEEWTVTELVDHIVAGPAAFAAMVRGEQVDWSAPTTHHDDPVAAFRDASRELLDAWASHPEAQPGADWQCAEVAVHTWDLSTALGRATRELDAEVAEIGARLHAGVDCRTSGGAVPSGPSGPPLPVRTPTSGSPRSPAARCEGRRRMPRDLVPRSMGPAQASGRPASAGFVAR